MLLDILFVAIIVVCVILGKKRGIIKTALGLSSTFISLIAAVMLYEPFMNMLATNETIAGLIAGAKENIKTAIMPMFNFEGMAESADAVPELLKTLVSEEIIGRGQEAVALAFAEVIIQLITVVAFVIVIKLLIAVVFGVTKLAAKLPVIKQANGLGGAILGFIIGIFVCWIVAAAMTMFIGQDGGWILQNEENSVFAKYLFRNNIILSFIK